MRKPKYRISIAVMVLLALAIGFGIFGAVLYFISPDNPTKDGQTNAVVGLLFVKQAVIYFFVGLAVAVFVYLKDKKRNEILEANYSISGRVTAIRYLRTVKFGSQNQHPFRVKYEYSYNGEEYNARSILYWEKPTLSENDEVKVFIDVENPKYSALGLQRMSN